MHKALSCSLRTQHLIGCRMRQSLHLGTRFCRCWSLWKQKLTPEEFQQRSLCALPGPPPSGTAAGKALPHIQSRSDRSRFTGVLYERSGLSGALLLKAGSLVLVSTTLAYTHSSRGLR